MPSGKQLAVCARPKPLLAPAEACKVETDCINSIRFLAVDAVNKASGFSERALSQPCSPLSHGLRLSTEISSKISCRAGSCGSVLRLHIFAEKP